jgi:ribosomal subunit interface protein
MQQPLQITVRGMASSPALEERIRHKVVSLERHSDRITSCHVTVEAPPSHQQQGKLYAVHLDIRLPDKQLVFGRTGHRDPAHEDVYLAIRDAFAAAERGLEQYAREQRRH